MAPGRALTETDQAVAQPLSIGVGRLDDLASPMLRDATLRTARCRWTKRAGTSRSARRARFERGHWRTYHPRVVQRPPTEYVPSTLAAAGVVLASGSGTRVGGELNKVYLPLAGRRVVGWSLRAFARVGGIGVLVLVIRPQDRDLADDVLADPELSVLLAGRPVEVVTGGGTRQESELMALRHLAKRIDAGALEAVLIHDGARPLVRSELITAVLRAMRRNRGVIPGLPRTDLVAVGSDGASVLGGDLGRVVTVQTPQGFPAAPLLAAYLAAARDGFVGTDTAACMARYSDVSTHCIHGDENNIKITYPFDVAIAERLMAQSADQPTRATQSNQGM